MERERRIIRYWYRETGACLTMEYDRFFVLGYVPNMGLNVGISFKCTCQSDADRIFGMVLGVPVVPANIQVITKDGVVIPVAVDGGNGYSKNLGTACFFGYIHEDVFDERPTGEY